jgi:hypothetical protein
MPASEYHLYRIKFIKPAQRKLFPPELSASEIFKDALFEKPAMELRRNNVWHIGNIEYFDEQTGVFAIGRTTKTTIEKFDDNTGDFVEQQDDSGPYTFVIFDRSIGLLGIAKKIKVAPKTAAIARRIKGLFEKTSVVLEHDIEVRVDLIPDPNDFIEKIQSAYTIKRFKAHFTGPNPVDADELFQKPLSVYCQQMGGDQGTVEVVGNSLNEETVEAVAKSTASTGNTASAKIQTKRGSRPVSSPNFQTVDRGTFSVA